MDKTLSVVHKVCDINILLFYIFVNGNSGVICWTVNVRYITALQKKSELYQPVLMNASTPKNVLDATDGEIQTKINEVFN